MDTPHEGHDGPYAAPVPLGARPVPAAWIDYNGHMNVAYYTLAFDQAVDRLLEDHLGVGEAHVARTQQGPYALQAHIHYLGELLEGTRFEVSALLVDHDAKRLHLMLRMHDVDTGHIAATCEQILMNVDLTTRRSAAYPEWAQTRLSRMKQDHARADRPAQMGRPIGIFRQG